MDEEKKGFPIPGKKPMFGGEGDMEIEARPLPESDFVMAFSNEAGDKAVVVTSVEDMGDGTIERHGRPEIEDYAMKLLDGGEDDMGLQVGEIYEGEMAEADAKAEALRLDEEHNPGPEATDAELLDAVDAMMGDSTVEEENELSEEEEENPDMAEPEMPDKEDIDAVEKEPMLGQLKKAKKFGE